MAFFGKKPSKEEEERKKVAEQRKAEFEEVMKLAEYKMPGAERLSHKTREYKEFLAEVRPAVTTLYEKACEFSEKILKLDLGPDADKALSEQLHASYINATPIGVTSLAILSGIILSFLVVLGLVAGIGSTFGAFAFALAGGVALYLYTYPATRAKTMLMRMSSDTVLAILYMIVYLRTSPNLEGALRFTSTNLSGPLSWDLKKLLWDLEVGAYPTADAALAKYAEHWKVQNEEFSSALSLLRQVGEVSPERRQVLFTETIQVILNGTRDRTKRFAAGLRMPIMVLHAMGVLLPVMGLVLFPIVVIFMADVVKPIFIFFGYDILLPLFLYFFMDHVLSSKPATFSQPDISRVRGMSPLGSFALGKTFFPIWPISVIIGLIPITIGLWGSGSSDMLASVGFSVLAIAGISAGAATYGILDSWQKMKVRKSIEEIEGEFPVALFQLGNALSGGEPMELAIDRATTELKGMRIADLFRRTSENMRRSGMTFEAALFDKDVGAVWDYPSLLIESIMRTLSEASKKSLTAAADSMVTISSYLKGVREVKSEIDEMLGETTSSMSFMAMFLAPMIAGVTVTMAMVIITILGSIGTQIAGLVGSGEGLSTTQNLLFFGPGMAGGKMPISAPNFQLIVGLYMFEVSVLMSVFLNRIEYGEDEIGERAMMGTTLIIATVVYIGAWLLTYSIFGSTLGDILTPQI